MDKQLYLEKRNEYLEVIDTALVDYVAQEKIQPLIRESMRYSLLSGGKRVRPIILLACNELCGGTRDIALPLAAGLEMIHTYSLIHDDLPAIDNDTMRRGRATNHVVFGEATAILTGDSFLNYAYEIMLEGADNAHDMAAYIHAMRFIAECCGPRYLIAGQVADLVHEGDVSAGLDDLNYIHDNKTGSLFRAAAVGGGIVGKANEETLEAFHQYSEALGLAFQITDDILDVKGGENLGKTAGKDAAAGKLTFVRVYGLERAEELAEKKAAEAIDALKSFGNEADFLRATAQFVIERDY